MSRLLRLDFLLIALVLVVATVVAVFPRADEDSGFAMIADDLEPLRAAFNADSENVRAVLLASPT